MCRALASIELYHCLCSPTSISSQVEWIDSEESPIKIYSSIAVRGETLLNGKVFCLNFEIDIIVLQC